MSLEAYYGDAGSGKGYTLVQVVIEAAKAGIPIVTTLELLPIFFTDFPDASVTLCKKSEKQVTEQGVRLVEERRVPFHKPVYGAIYVLDELHEIIDDLTGKKVFFSGVAQDRVPSHVIDFMSKRRQFHDDKTGRGIQIVFDTQNPSLVARWVKTQVELATYCEKHLEAGTTRAFKRLAYKAPSCKGDRRSKADLVSTEVMLPYLESVYKYYKSQGYALQDVKVLDEKRLTKGASIFRNFKFWFMIVGLYFLIVGGYEAWVEFTDPKLFQGGSGKAVAATIPQSFPKLTPSPSRPPVIPQAYPVPQPSPSRPPTVFHYAVGTPVGREGSHLVGDGYQGGICRGYVVKQGVTYRFCKAEFGIYYIKV